MKILKIIVCVILILGALAIGSTALFAGKVVDAVNTELSATPVPAVAVMANEEAILANHKVVVSNIEAAVVNEYAHVPEGIEVGCVNITVTNTGSEDILISSTDFKLYKNNVLCEDYIYGDKWFMAETLGGGRVFTGVLYYQIPVGTGDSILELEYSYDYKGSKVIFKVN